MADKNFGQPKQSFSFMRKNSSEDSRVLWSSYTPFNANSSKPTEAQLKAHDDAVRNGKIVSHLADNPDLSIWKRVDSGSNLQDMYGQHSLQSLKGLKPGDMLTFFDFENVGTAPHNRTKPEHASWYSPLELAAQKVKVKDDYTLERVGGGLSMVIKPTGEDHTEMNNLIKKIKGMKGKTWTGLTADEWRSANDLILYAHNNPFDEKNGLFEIRDGVTHIRMQNRLDQAVDGTIFSSKHVKMMEKGLENVTKHGNTPDVVARELLSYFRSADGGVTKLGGFNIKNFDVPMMMDWIDSRLAPHVTDSHIRGALSKLRNDLSNVQMIDSRQVLNTVFKDKAERYGPNGLTQEGIADSRNINKSAAHIGIVDVWTNIDVHNNMVKQDGLMSVVNGAPTGVHAARFNPEEMQADKTKLFSLHGMTLDKQKGAWDNVFKVNSVTKEFEPVYGEGFRVAPLSKDTSYTFHKKFSSKMADGKLYHGVMLKNEDTGNYHMIARENPDELRNLIHRSLVPEEEARSYISGSKKFNATDKARREWDKMFSWENGGGRYLFEKYSKLHNVYGEYASQGFTGDALKQFVLADPKLQGEKGPIATETMFRNYEMMKDRFGSEFTHVNEFIGKLDSQLPQEGKYKPRSHDIALKTYADLIDKHLGENRSDFEKPQGRYGLSVTIGDKENHIDLSSQRSAATGIRALVDNTNQPTLVVKQRLEQLLSQAQASGMSTNEVNKFKGMINNLKDGQSPYVIVDDLSAYLSQKASTDATFGLKTINLDDPTKVTDNRQRLLTDADFRADIQQKAIGHAQTFHGKAWNQAGTGIRISDPTFRKLIDEHDSSVLGLWNHVRGDSALGIKPIKAEHTLGRMINDYSQDGIKSQIVYNAKTDSMHLVLANEDVAKQVFGLQANEILEHAKVAHVAIPMLDGKGNIKMPGNTRIARSKIFELQGGKLGFGTAFEQAVFGINKRAKTAREMLKDGRAKDVTSMLKAAVREEIQSFSINNQYIDPEDMLRQDTRLSKTARYARSGHVDVTALAERWYSFMYQDKDPRFNDKLRRKKERIDKDKSLSFYNTLSKDELREFHITIDPFAEQFGLKTNMHNIKDVHALNGMRSAANASVQNLLPFGYLDQMGRENIVKHGNYLPLDSRLVKRNLKSAGISDNRAQRILNRGLMTDVGVEALKGETSFLNLRTVYQDNAQIAHRMDKAALTVGKMAVDEMASVYDGGIIVRDDVAKAFTVGREKKISLNDDAVIPEKIRDLFEKSGMFESVTDKDSGKVSYALKNGYEINSEANHLGRVAEKINKVGSAHYGHYTVGQMTIDGELQSANYFTGQNPNTWVKGFDAEKNQLILETREFMRGGVKLGSESGDRVTAIIRSKEWFKQMGYKDSDEVISANISSSKGMEGAKARSTVNYAIDRVHEAIDNGTINANTIKSELGEQEFSNKGYTVGKMTKDEIRSESMDMMARLMKDELGINDVSKANSYQLQMNFNHALDGENKVGQKSLNSFTQEASAKFGIDVHGGDAIRGNVGFSVADVYNWENQVGYIKGRGKGGLVRWGDKEVAMIERRANQVLGDDNVVSKWLHGHVDKAAERQGGDGVKKYIAGLAKAVLDSDDHEFQTGKKAVTVGELVVKSHGDSFMYKDGDAFKGERKGTETGRITSDGVYEVSTNAFNDLPISSGPNDKLTVGRYHKTILTAGDVELNFNGEKKSLQGMIDANGGTFLYQLPEGFSHSHVRMLDQKLVGLGAEGEEAALDGRMPVLGRLQKAQLQLWRSVKDYNQDGAGDKNRNQERVQNAIDNYHKELDYLTSSSREGSVSRISGAKMDMSGRFRSQGVNPFVNGGAIKEGEYIVGKEQMKRMINGAEHDILHSVGGEHLAKYKKTKAYWDDQINKEKDAFKQGQLKDWLYGTKLESGGRTRGYMDDRAQKYVLDYAKDKGLYGVVGRYPTIETDTLNVLNVKWSDKVHGDTGIMSMATAFALNDDHDGDFNSVVLAHYKKENGSPSGEEMHNALKEIQEAGVNGHGELPGLNALHDELVKKMQGEDVLKYLDDNNMTMDQLTVGHLSKIEGFRDNFLPKVGKMYDLETAIARLGKGDVGPLDNLRLRMFNIANPVYKTLTTHRGMDANLANEKIAHIEEFGRMISQNAISSKKFTQNEILKTMKIEDNAKWGNAKIEDPEVQSEMIRRMTADRYAALDELVQGIQRGDNEGISMIHRANKTLGLFSNEAGYDAKPLEYRVAKDQKYSLNTMLDTLQELRSHVGQHGWVKNLFQMIGTSMGPQDIQQSASALKAGDGLYTPTPVMQHLADASPEVAEYAKKGNKIFEQTVLANHDRLNGDDDIFNIADSRMPSRNVTQTADKIDTMTVAEGAGVKMRQVMGKMTGGKLSQVHARGAMWGAAAFGAMWAASAITRSGPTPEGLQEQMNQGQAPAQAQSQPTARVAMNGEHVNISVNAKNAKGLSHDQIAAAIQAELGSQTQTQMNMNMNVNDNTQDLSNSQWLQGVVSNALGKGYGF